MKTKLLTILLVIAAVTVNVAIAGNDNDKGKAKGPGRHAKAPDLEMIEFIHWKSDTNKAKPDRCDGDGICEPGEDKKTCEDCTGGGEDPPPEEPTNSCYAFIGQYGKTYLKWREPIDLVINYDVPENFDAPLSASLDEWDSYTYGGPSSLVFGYMTRLEDTDVPAPWGVLDGVNAICYGDNYLNPGVIAVTRLWYNPATKSIAEFDISFEYEPDQWTWGIVVGGEDLMDVQNIATHELGHGLGLADIDAGECDYVTMYHTSYSGDVEKRDLADPDIEAIQILYP